MNVFTVTLTHDVCDSRPVDQVAADLMGAAIRLNLPVAAIIDGTTMRATPTSSLDEVLDYWNNGRVIDSARPQSPPVRPKTRSGR